MISQVSESARAKVNLTLRIIGRRSDGYHALQSLVVFADIADQLVLTPGGEFALHVTGPFAQKIEGGNLIQLVCERVLDSYPGMRAGSFHLEKNLPVAAGIGGGSADAAAALRTINFANPEVSTAIDWMKLAASIGADVPVCYVGRSSLMEGIGEIVRLVFGMPEFSLLLVNSGVQISTAEIFRRLNAPSINQADEVDAPFIGQKLPSFEAMVDLMRNVGNDLEEPALELCPGIADIKSEIAHQDGCAHAALSGSGATCFGVFQTHALAVEAERRMAAAHPSWWVKAARVV